MGGKNAIIVDDDADLDEAVVGVIHSAFGYSGQKCSACSRVIVLEGIHDAFLARLVEAAQAVKVGPADDPETLVGPVIDADARRRILEYQRIAATEGRVVSQVDPGPIADQGYFVGPMIVADVAPDGPDRPGGDLRPGPGRPQGQRPGRRPARSPTAPQYALTGGLYSRSPANIERVSREFRVGNLYINRGITGALVDRQPFGGFKLSGHRHQGRRARLPARVPAHPVHHREHHAPGVRARGCRERAEPDGRVRAGDLISIPAAILTRPFRMRSALRGRSAIARAAGASSTLAIRTANEPITGSSIATIIVGSASAGPRDACCR